MQRATRVFRKDEWSGIETDTVVLEYEARHRRRVAMTGQKGVEFLLDLPEATALRDGDGLLLDDGRIVKVRAAPEGLREITGEPALLMRVAWHLGNRHLPAELLPDRIRIRHDHVIEAMVAGLGAGIREVWAPFEPEGGAYAGHDAHDHAHHRNGHEDHHHDDHGHGGHGHGGGGGGSGS
jgi:urease accessory protein